MIKKGTLYQKLLRVEALIQARQHSGVDEADEDDNEGSEDDCPCDSGKCGCGPCKKKRLAASARRRYA